LILSDNPLTSFESLSREFTALEVLRCDRTNIASFKGAIVMPTLQVLSIARTPLSQHKCHRVMAVIVFGDSLKRVTQTPVSPGEARWAAKNRPLLEASLRAGWILLSTDPMIIFNPETHERVRLFPDHPTPWQLTVDRDPNQPRVVVTQKWPRARRTTSGQSNRPASGDQNEVAGKSADVQVKQDETADAPVTETDGAPVTVDETESTGQDEVAGVGEETGEPAQGDAVVPLDETV
jgi:hypothetical protein